MGDEDEDELQWARVLQQLARVTLNLLIYPINRLFSCLSRLLESIIGNGYERLDEKAPDVRKLEPVPYEDQPGKRFLSYHCTLILGALLYLFLYYVLVKHHSLTVIGVAFLLMIIYLIILENSHTIRSILMLCLPIMFTNRGRALVFCSMLAMMTAGPVHNTQFNIGQLHMSINCCKQFLIIRTDKYIDDTVIQNIIKVEAVIYQLVDSIKQFADELREKFFQLLDLAITIERYIELSIRKLIEIINICNKHTDDVYGNCYQTLEFAYTDCYSKLSKVSLQLLCEIVRPLKEVCSTVKIPAITCIIPASIARYLDQTIGQRLRYYIHMIQNEFYVEVDIEHGYSYNVTKSKPYSVVLSEIKLDIERKFWYVSLVTKVFNLFTLIIVLWILVTATLYHMHYLSELNYDNMYLDDQLERIDRERRGKKSKVKLKLDSIDWKTADIDDESLLLKTATRSPYHFEEDDKGQQVLASQKGTFLFPLPPNQAENYLKPFSLRMNEEERMKLIVASLIWLVIVGFVFFFVLLDFSLYSLIDTIDELLDEILFKGDLPLVDVKSRLNDNAATTYNRTYLAHLRQNQQSKAELNRLSYLNRTGSLSGLYRRLMDSVERNIPDDVAILDSLQSCLPKIGVPNYRIYKTLTYLAAFTFCAVLVEAYALRARHCFANLFYPRQARRRALWLYQKLLLDKPKFEQAEQQQRPSLRDKVRKGLMGSAEDKAKLLLRKAKRGKKP